MSKPLAARAQEHERDWWLVLFGAGMVSEKIREAMKSELNFNLLSGENLEMTNAVISSDHAKQLEWLSDHCGVVVEEGDKPLRAVFETIVEYQVFKVMKAGHGALVDAAGRGPYEYVSELERQLVRCRKLLPEVNQPPQAEAA